jgi:hypothetical protein
MSSVFATGAKLQYGNSTAGLFAGRSPVSVRVGRFILDLKSQKFFVYKQDISKFQTFLVANLLLEIQ